MDSPFTITPRQIADMSAEEQTELGNLLIRDEARRLGMPYEQVLTTDKIDVPDESVDAITEAAPAGGEHIPAGDAIWQFKKPRPDWRRLKEDLSKSPAATDFFARGAGYVYLEGGEMTAIATLRRSRKLAATLADVGCVGPVRFLNAKQVAEWAASIPSAVFLLQRETRGYFRPDRLLSFVRTWESLMRQTKSDEPQSEGSASCCSLQTRPHLQPGSLVQRAWERHASCSRC